MRIIDTVEQGSQEWLDMRLGRITASKASDLMSKGRGATPSKMSETYMMDLIAEKLTGESKPFFENDAMKWGTVTEPQARLAYEMNHDIDVVEVAFIEADEYCGVSPDGLVGDTGLVEFKCPNTSTQIKRALSNDYSADYKAQIQMQLLVSGREWCDFVSFDPRLNCDAYYLEQRVYRDEPYIEEMKAKIEAFVAKMNEILTKLEG